MAEGPLPGSVRRRLPPPRHPDGSLVANGGGLRPHRRNVLFCHPGYPDSANAILILPALDPLPHNGTQPNPLQPGRFGVHCETARVACAILANSRFDGYLSESPEPDGDTPATPPDTILLKDKYYFHIPLEANAPNVPYPVVPSFEHFRFPHRLPPSWSASSLSIPDNDNAIRTRDLSCRITASTLGTEAAHLIPRSEGAWFLSNEMTRYAVRPSPSAAAATDDTANALLLRSDMHTIFDQRRFAIVPKWGRWVIQALSGTPTEELPAVYHNVELQPLAGIATEYIFARFAWSVVIQASFLCAGVARWLALVEAEGVSVTREISMDRMSTYAPRIVGSKSRSQSPRKRVRDEADTEFDLVDDDDDGDDYIWDIRGRPRKRRVVDTIDSYPLDM